MDKLLKTKTNRQFINKKEKKTNSKYMNLILPLSSQALNHLSLSSFLFEEL
jgi:hypothetical protein